MTVLELAIIWPGSPEDFHNADEADQTAEAQQRRPRDVGGGARHVDEDVGDAGGHEENVKPRHAMY